LPAALLGASAFGGGFGTGEINVWLAGTKRYQGGTPWLPAARNHCEIALRGNESVSGAMRTTYCRPTSTPPFDFDSP